MNNNLPKESADTKIYAPPICEVVLVDAREIICYSGDDAVGNLDLEELY